MPRTYTAALQSLLDARTFRRATLWQIDREDGVTLRFTDHDIEIEYDGETFSPAGGFDASARQQNAESAPQNLEVIGMIASGAITEKDLRDGRYRNAEITETVVDWRYPWVGAFVVNKYWIVETEHNGESWVARLEGMKRWLIPDVGNIFSRNCRHELGDSMCGVALGGFTESRTVTTVNDARLEFLATGMTATADYFAYGKLTWTSGNNNGLVFDVKMSGAGPLARLQLPTPDDIQVGDTFDIIAGCDKLHDTCKTKFSNLVNYGGFPFIPGTDKLMQKPKARP